MAISSGNFAELLWPGIREIWGHKYERYPTLYTQIFAVKDSDKRFEKEQGVTGLPLASEKKEGGAVAYVDPFQGFQKEYHNLPYGQGVIVTREMYEDDQYNYINALPALLAESGRQTEETLAFNHLNRAFNSSFTGADGVSLCNASHTLVGGGTFRNQLATAADLTQTSLEQAIQDIMDFVDDQSLKLRAMPKKLVVPTQLVMRATKLLVSEQVTGSADNDVNPLTGYLTKRDLVVSPYLTDTDAWFIVTDVPNGLTWNWRRRPELSRDNEFDTENLKFKQTWRSSSGWTNPRGVFGTPGA